MELSIVLIIIGLIVGGVLGGQSLIKSAELQRVVNELNQYKTAVNAFRLEFSAIPGDMDNAWNYWQNTGNCVDNTEANCNGDGNGLIDKGDGDGGAGQRAAFNHLSLSGILPGNYTGVMGTNGDGFFPGENVPQLFVKPTTLVYRSYGITTDVHSLVTGNVIQMATITNIGSVRAGAFSPKDAKAIDTKIDDGLASRGKLVAQDHEEDSKVVGRCFVQDGDDKITYIPGYTFNADDANNNILTATYNLSQSNQNSCWFIYSIE